MIDGVGWEGEEKVKSKFSVRTTLGMIFTVYAVLSLLMFFILMFDMLEGVTEENTTGFAATVTGLNFNEQNKTYIIYTNEYGNSVRISDKSCVIDEAQLNNLEFGDVIVFRVKNSVLDDMGTIIDRPMVYIVSLSVGSKEIITLESYYTEVMFAEATIAMVMTGIVTVVLVAITIKFYSPKRKKRV